MEPFERAQVLDQDVVASLKELGEESGTNLFLELVEIFLEDATLQIQELSDALDRQDLAQIERSAHSLKSSCANIGAVQMSGLCFELEKQGRSGVMEGVPGLFELTREAYARLCGELDKERA